MQYDVVATRGQGNQYLLIARGSHPERDSKAMGWILSLEDRRLWPPRLFQTILAQGYWQEVESSPELVSALFARAGLSPDGTKARS